MNSSFGVTSVDVRDLESGTLAGRIVREDMIEDTCVCSDSRTLAVMSKNAVQGCFSMYDIESGQQKGTSIPLPALGQSIAACPSQPLAAVMSENGNVQIVDCRNGEVISEFNHEDWTWPDLFHANQSRLRWTPDGESLLTLTPQNKIFVRDGSGSKVLYAAIQPQITGYGLLRTFDISSDSSLLATAVTGKKCDSGLGSEDGKITL